MMNTLLSTGAALLAVASALPQRGPPSPVPTWRPVNQLARFENADGLPLVAAAPINTYLDIFWQGMSLVETGNVQNIAIVQPNSPSNCAAFSKLDLATVQQGQPSMTTNYANSSADHFDLRSFYFGCALGTQASVAAVPQSCFITIKGYKDVEATQLAGVQSFTYPVRTIQTSSQMINATVTQNFSGLKRVDFFVSGDLTTAALIDTVDYTVYVAV